MKKSNKLIYVMTAINEFYFASKESIEREKVLTFVQNEGVTEGELRAFVKTDLYKQRIEQYLPNALRTKLYFNGGKISNLGDLLDRYIYPLDYYFKNRTYLSSTDRHRAKQH